MGINTSIEWADSTLNLQMGCDGCELWIPRKGIKKCYAGVQTERYGGNKGYPLEFGHPQLFLNRLNEARSWKDLSGSDRIDKPWLNGLPRMIFLNDMGDTFTESLPWDWLGVPAAKFSDKSPLQIMGDTPHMYMLLTKRAGRMKKFFGHYDCPDNFILGVSVTNSSTLKRVSTLLSIPCRFRFISYEPAWGPINLSPHLRPLEGTKLVHLVIGGGESGVSAEPCKLDWLLNMASQCSAAGVPAFVKQLGSNPIGLGWKLRDRKGGDMSEWPESLRVREFLWRERA